VLAGVGRMNGGAEVKGIWLNMYEYGSYIYETE
jgi:hypothetical protein